MIYFITTRANSHRVFDEYNDYGDFESLITLSPKDVFPIIRNFIRRNKEIGFDTEDEGLNPLNCEMTICTIGNIDNQFVFDCYESLAYLKDLFLYIQKRGNTIVGQNLKFDIKYIISNLNHLILNPLYDIMIADQKMFHGFNDYANNINRLSFSLEGLVKRYLRIDSKNINKAIRDYFIGKKRKDIILFTQHIIYAARDVKYPLLVMACQKPYIERYNMQFLIYHIHFNLIKVLAECEMRGFILNVSELKKMVAEYKIDEFRLKCELDKEVRHLRDTLMSAKDRFLLVGGQWDRERIKSPTQINEGLFGEPLNYKALTSNSKKIKENIGNTNYKSDKDLRIIFGFLKQPIPTHNGTYEIPKINLKTGKVDNSHLDFTMGGEQIEVFIQEFPNAPTNKFFKLLLELRTLEKKLSTYGENLIDLVNPNTGRIHTIFRQAVAINGRLQSGETKNGFINFQNIPKEKRVRSLFGTDSDRWVDTRDLSGAEAVILASKSNDRNLIRLIKLGDVHSEIATKGWRAIYKLQRDNTEMQFLNDDINSVDYGQLYPNHEWMILNDKANNFTVSKKENTDKRNIGKNETFGTIYGSGIGRTSRTLGVTFEEAKAYKKTIKESLPDAFKLVEANADFAVKNGYLILNNRTNSRIWFPIVHEANQAGRLLTGDEEYAIRSEAKNIPISGTQADMIQEAMIEIFLHGKKNNWDIYLLNQVHDENVYDLPDENKEVKSKFISDTMQTVANRYLQGIEMGIEGTTEKTWTK